MDLQLKHKVALVTGGAKGIGAAVSAAFAAEGCRIAIVTRHSTESEAFARKLEEQADVLYLGADLSEAAKCKDAVDAVVKRFGGIDILVNNAGVNDGAGLDAGLAAFERSLRANLLHVYGMTHHALPHLKKSRGNIINISSKVAETGQGGTSGYAAAKGAMNALTREWALELAPFGIRANAVIPAECMTPLYAKWLATLPDPEGRRRAIESKIPLGHRMTLDTELAGAVVFLASPRSGHTTGQLFHVDGGYVHLDRAVS
jgi:NAD(P)-dependent dehydrogenase (short-subunit alcohol dehydrogenase family)